MQVLGYAWLESDTQSSRRRELLTPLEVPLLPGSRQLLEYWKERQDKGGIISGRDIPSRALAPILRNVMVYEAVDGGKDFRIRLAGAGIMRRFGRDVGGKTLSELFPEDVFQQHCASLRGIIETGHPNINEVWVQEFEGSGLRFERLGLPMFAPDGITGWVLCGLFFYDVIG
jgi:hypothetical protein